MPPGVPSDEVDELAARRAERAGVSKTEAAKRALQNELRRVEQAGSLTERLRPLQERVLSRPATGCEADKAFYDELSGGL